MPSSSPRSVSLKPFSPVDPAVVRALTVYLNDIGAGRMSLRYELDADLERVRVPGTRQSRAADELWKHTCFEAFIRPAGGKAYYELNASPSTEWALYSFDDYRKGMTSIRPDLAPVIRVGRGDSSLRIDVDLAMHTLPASGHLALAAVLELEEIGVSYWAVEHRGIRPDFHHPDSFVVEL